MEISKKVEAELKLTDLVKPEIFLNDEWEWEWSDVSGGIREREVKEFKHFLQNSITILPYYLNEAKRLTQVAERNKTLDKFQLDQDVFTPFLTLLHSPKQDSFDVEFIMQFTWDGQIFVDREEDIWVPYEQSSPSRYHSQLHLRWNLGQLHQK